jgi:hypothetical protein
MACQEQHMMRMDAVNIAKVQSSLDWEYLKKSSNELDVDDLLERLTNEIKKT